MHLVESAHFQVYYVLTSSPRPVLCTAPVAREWCFRDNISTKFGNRTATHSVIIAHDFVALLCF